MMGIIKEVIRKRRFNRIKKSYDEKDDAEVSIRGNVLKDTSYGFFVPSNMDKVFELFSMIELQKYRNFVDLGSGDGRIVLIASLFTKATGIESDSELHKESLEMMNKLGLKARFEQGDYMEHDISRYDAVYMYPDKKISPGLNKKLKKELKGELIIYTNMFLPKELETREIKIDYIDFYICKNI